MWRYDVDGGKALKINIPIAWKNTRENTDEGLRIGIQQQIGSVDVFYVGSHRQFTRDEVDTRINQNNTTSNYFIWLYSPRSRELGSE